MSNYRALLFLLIVCSLVIFVGYKGWKAAEEAAYQSCVLSLHTALIKNFKNNKSLSEAISPEPEWRVLSEREVQLLFESLGGKNQFDCKNYPDSANGRNKAGEYLRIAARQNDGLIYLTIEGTGIYQEPFQTLQTIR
jgi:hypothetical protein